MMQYGKNTYDKYEISNFSKRGFECKHNLNYWNCGEWIGIGPGAHSRVKGKNKKTGKKKKKLLKGLLAQHCKKKMRKIKELGRRYVLVFESFFAPNMWRIARPFV